jgi:hypothetical protein
MIPARRRKAPIVRFISFEIFATGVLAFECALSVRTSSLVHGITSRRAVFAEDFFGALLFFVVAFFAMSSFLEKSVYSPTPIGIKLRTQRILVVPQRILFGNIAGGFFQNEKRDQTRVSSKQRG